MADSGETLTYGELVLRAHQTANLFSSLGLTQGETIAILIENSIRCPELMWAAKDSGIRYVVVNTHLNAADTSYLVADSGAKLLIASPATLGLARAALVDLQHVALITLGAAHEELLSAQPSTPLIGRHRGPSMLYSSGTTGRPKGVKTSIEPVSPDTPPRRFAMLQEKYGLGADTVFLNPGPFYHAGPNRFMMSVLRAGGTVVGFSKFDAGATLNAIAHYNVTHGFFVPTMFGRMLALPDEIRASAQLSTMRHAIHAAAPCPIEVKRRMIEWWGTVIDELYAGTEAFGHTFISSKEWLEHPGSVGKPAAGCEIRIVGPNGSLCAPGEPGRIMMSNGLRIEYHGDAAKSALLYDSDGFASLGDIGFLDAEGYLYLTDRESHMIIVGGVNIYPQEAEAVLERHPAVADVAVIGVPDNDMGESVKAIVELIKPAKPSEALAEDIIAFCRAELSLHKCPRTVDFVDVLPRNPVGKLNKSDLRARYRNDG